MPVAESAEYLASDSGQNTSMPPVKSPNHPLGPFAPRPTGRMASTQPEQGVWMASPTGQFPAQAGPSNAGMAIASHPAPPQKGTGPDEVALPNPGGQYSHNKVF